MIYEKIIRPLLFRSGPEQAHEFASRFLQCLEHVPALPFLFREMNMVSHSLTEQTLWSLPFENPVGLAAGMDKTGKTLPAWQMLGFGFLEAGGFTKNEQEGNPKPRMFRLTEDEAIINRMGFNNPGAEKAREHFRKMRRLEVPLGINIGKSKDTPNEEAHDDYAYTFERLYPFGDFFVVNVSSPNTLGLRDLQAKSFLTGILQAVRLKANRQPHKPRQRLKPILVKISPDLTSGELDEVLEVCSAEDISGIIAANTTTERKNLKSSVNETGGLSGPPLFERALLFVRRIRTRLPSMPIIGVSGINSAHRAYEMIRAGANLVQIYTSLIYEGPGLPRRINAGLVALMEKAGTNIRSFSPNVKRD